MGKYKGVKDLIDNRHTTRMIREKIETRDKEIEQEMRILSDLRRLEEDIGSDVYDLILDAHRRLNDHDTILEQN